MKAIAGVPIFILITLLIAILTTITVILMFPKILDILKDVFLGIFSR